MSLDKKKEDVLSEKGVQTTLSDLSDDIIVSDIDNLTVCNLSIKPVSEIRCSNINHINYNK